MHEINNIPLNILLWQYVNNNQQFAIATYKHNVSETSTQLGLYLKKQHSAIYLKTIIAFQ